MVFGRKKEASDEEAEPWERNRNPPLPADRRSVPAADRRRVGRRRQHLHQRRLRQLARRQVRQERRLGEVAGASRAAGRASSTRRTASRPTRKGNIYVGDRGNVRIQVFDTDGKFLRQIKLDVPPAAGRAGRNRQHADRRTRRRDDERRRAVGRLHHARSEPGALRRRDAFPGRIYKVSLDGKVLGVLGKAGKQPKQFGGSTRSRARRKTSCTSPRPRTGACRSCCCIPIAPPARRSNYLQRFSQFRLQAVAVAAAEREPRASCSRTTYSPLNDDRSSWMRSTLTMVERWMRTNCCGSSCDSRWPIVSRTRCVCCADVQAHVVAGGLAPVDVGRADEVDRGRST